MLALAQANLKEAASSLLAAKQRTLLALVGIAIGIGSVIAMISVGVIARDEALRQFQELGTDILTITFQHSGPAGGLSAVTPDEALGVTRLAAIAAAAPYAVSYAQFALPGREAKDVMLLGATATLPDLNKLKIETGRHISDLDLRRYFCVIGSEVAAALRATGIQRLVGEAIEVAGSVYTIVGVLRRTPKGMRDFDVNHSIIVPLSTAQRVFRQPEIHSITARLSPGTYHVTAELKVGDYFRRISPGIEVRVRSAEHLIEQMHKQMRLFALLLGSVGGISLLVGGIGVMNVMLVSVSERRREIGIRRALGARRMDIQSQFLIESVVLSLAAGVIGVGAGVGVTWAICQFTDWAFRISMLAVGLGVGVASAAGVFFGFYPAYRAARLDPVTALRGS
ncbi:MAG: ABC transporter permease [Gammaproteobacteria bacterium]|nr:ABC transporter permease [Gammaproteobacteria bacterium]